MMVHKRKVLSKWCHILGHGARNPGLDREGYLARPYTLFPIRQPQRKYAAHRIGYGHVNIINIVLWHGTVLYMQISNKSLNRACRQDQQFSNNEFRACAHMLPAKSDAANVSSLRKA